MLLKLFRTLVLVSIVAGFTGYAHAQQPIQLSGVSCTPLPFLQCPDKDCPPERVINQGPAVEIKTRRTYFLDYPCDLKPGEKATFILSLHSAWPRVVRELAASLFSNHGLQRQVPSCYCNPELSNQGLVLRR